MRVNLNFLHALIHVEGLFKDCALSAMWYVNFSQNQQINDAQRRTETQQTKHEVMIECWFLANMCTSSMKKKKKSPLHLSLSPFYSDLCMQAYLQNVLPALKYLISPHWNDQQPLKYKDSTKKLIHTKGSLSPVLKICAKMSPHFFLFSLQTVTCYEASQNMISPLMYSAVLL